MSGWSVKKSSIGPEEKRLIEHHRSFGQR